MSNQLREALRSALKLNRGRSVREAYWSGNDHRGYYMDIMGFELTVIPADRGAHPRFGQWVATAVHPNNSQERIGEFKGKQAAMDAATDWARQNKGKAPLQPSLL